MPSVRVRDGQGLSMAVCAALESSARGRDYELTLPVVDKPRRVGRGRSRPGPGSAQRPGALGAGQPEGQEPARVEPCEAVVQPQVVEGGSAEPQPAVAAGNQ